MKWDKFKTVTYRRENKHDLLSGGVLIQEKRMENNSFTKPLTQRDCMVSPDMVVGELDPVLEAIPHIGL